MKLRVDTQLCTGYGSCRQIAPDVFELDELGFNCTPPQTVAAHLEEQAIEGAAACPESAIVLTDD